MLEEKRKDLDGEKQKRLLQRLVGELSAQGGDVYYQPTSVIAAMIKDYVQTDAKLAADDKALLTRLSQRDIEVLLSLR